ncbi:CoA transferase [Sulfobacillus harzensis]|uniref:CoA-transferase family III n=1 Tax=Sulfobacillus harzensis TaxID=2729629 RepID=A0A7Y0L712_9FIRM|nr:CoA transferase [Sulfobacillus harzensis]NMP23610.1 hypothetical protein [Sulfobacillus harzensis]
MADEAIQEITAALWRDAVGIGPLPHFEVTGQSGRLPARHPVEAAATATIAVALMAAATLEQARGRSTPTIEMDRGHVAAAMRSGSWFRYQGRSLGMDFAALSRFWPTKDGWVRTHANYPWHRQALLRVLKASESPQDVAAAIADWNADDLEAAVFDAGGVAVQVRTPELWALHPQGAALQTEPLIRRSTGAPAPSRIWPGGALPAEGLRVLDLTRVIAGPVCTRYLAALGASVLRLDPPTRPDLPLGLPADTLLGKKSAQVDFATPKGRSILERLLSEADIVVLGYRPGALDRFGLSAGNLSQQFPGLVIVELDAWGYQGPWARRRGFDSLVQAASGIAWIEGGGSGAPGALPCQLLDHGTGYLAAAAALEGVVEQRTVGGTPIRRLSLARTALWLMSLERTLNPGEKRPDRSQAWMADLPDDQEALLPVGRWNGRPLTWPKAAAHYGSDAPAW